jgi:hypothetical protein
MLRLLPLLIFFVAALPRNAVSQVWTPVPETGRISVNALLEHRGVLFAATEEAVFRSTDGGSSWITSEPFPITEKYPVVSSLVAVENRLFAGTLLAGVLTSSDGGRNWTTYDDGLAGFARRIAGLALRGDTLYAATDGAGIYMRDIASNTSWQQYNAGIGWNGGNAIAVLGDRLCAVVSRFCFIRTSSQPAWEFLPWTEAGTQINSVTLYANGGFLFAGTQIGVFRWNGVDSMWSRCDLAPSPNRLVTAFTTHGQDLYASIFLSERSHMLAVSSDSGDSWRQVETTDGEVLALHAARGRLWSARADGLWYRDIESSTGTGELPVPSPAVLLPPYPNPSSGRVNITFELPKDSPVTLLVCDVLGRIVSRLTQVPAMPPGSHTLTADLGKLPPGRYTLLLRSATGTSVRPLIRTGGQQ